MLRRPTGPHGWPPLPQDRCQDRTVHLRIVNDQDLLPRLLRCFLRSIFHVFPIRAGHCHRVFAVLGLIHHPVRLPDCPFDGICDGLHHAADADGRAQMGIAKNDRFLHALPDLLQLGFQILRRNARQQK